MNCRYDGMIACQTKTFEKKNKYCATFDHLREEIYSLLFGCSNRCCFHWTLFLVFYKVEIASYVISTKLRTKAFRLVNKHKYLALNVKKRPLFLRRHFRIIVIFCQINILVVNCENRVSLFVVFIVVVYAIHPLPPNDFNSIAFFFPHSFHTTLQLKRERNKKKNSVQKKTSSLPIIAN